jgi:hypothetical protein
VTKKERAAAYHKKRWANDPEYRAKRQAATLKWKKKKWDSDPEYRAARLTEIKASNAVAYAWVVAYKLEKGCADCGYRAHHAALDFDHTKGKTQNIGNMRSIPAIIAEIEKHKCEVVCANCHRIRTVNRRTK